MLKKSLLVVFTLFSSTAFASLETTTAFIPTTPPDHQLELKKNAKKTGPIGDYSRLLLAEKHLKSHNSKDALRIVSGVREPIFEFWKNVVQAEVYLSLNKPRQSLALLIDLPIKPNYKTSYVEGLYGTLYKRALLTRYLAAKKTGGNGHDSAALLLVYFPADKDLNKLFANTSIRLNKKQKMEKVHNLYTRYRYKKIPTIITAQEIKSSRASKYLKCQALYELAKSLIRKKDYRGQSIENFKDVVKSKCPEDFTPSALYWLGSLKPAEGSEQTDVRESSLKQLHAKYPNHRVADDALYKLYKIASNDNKTSAAKKYYTQLMARKKGDMKSVLAFQLAFPLYEKGKYKKSSQILAKALNSEPLADETYPRVLYWYARSLEQIPSSKNKKIVADTYNRLVTKFPFSFYALLAAKRTNTAVKHPNLPNLSGTAPTIADDYFSLANLFNRKGYHHAARSVIDFAMHFYPNIEKTHPEYLAKQLLLSQNYRKSLDIAATTLGSGVYGPITDQTKHALFAALYPFAFKDKTKRGYELTELPFGAIEGLMREESLFQTTAKSHAGAMGLMQLMPSTAAMVKKKVSVFLDPSITDPQSNIILGSTYLRDMKNYFDDQLPLAIMAYNAGPGNVRKWLKRFGEKELDVFIEKVPLSETRNYVKRVMRSMHVYGTLYKEPFFKKTDYFSFQITN